MTTEERGETSDLDSFSGAEVEPPHKIFITDKDKNGTLPGIGDVSTRWVSSKGRHQLLYTAQKKQEVKERASLQKELQILAIECKKALEALENGESSTHTQVVSAHQLCDVYIPKSTVKSTSRQTLNQRLEELWKTDQASGSETGDLGSTCATATNVLGEELVDTITQKHKLPPDVSQYSKLLF